MTDRSELMEGRIRHVREVCLNCLDRDVPTSDRAWLATAVLNILGGKIDWQIREEIGRDQFHSGRRSVMTDRSDFIPGVPTIFRCQHGERTDIPTTVYAGAIYFCECCHITYGSLNREPVDRLCPFCHAGGGR